MHAIIRCGTYVEGDCRLSIALRKGGGYVVSVDGEKFEFGADGARLELTDKPQAAASSGASVSVPELTDEELAFVDSPNESEDSREN